MSKLPPTQGYMWEGCEPDPSSELRKKFVIPPFSVLDAKQGYWQERKRQWLALGIKSELGRGEGITWGDSDAMRDGALNHYRKREKAVTFTNQSGLNAIMRQKKNTMAGKSNLLGHPDTTGDLTFYDQKRKAEKKLGRELSLEEFRDKHYIPAEGEIQSGTSIFDPVLCEVIYRWFSPEGGKVLDPFAGGSVRGIVANYLGREYTGIELSSPQVKANIEQGREILPDKMPTWIEGDSRNIPELVSGQFDLVFSCPPYYDLEVYSDLPQDLSTLVSYDKFLESYHQIIGRAVRSLKPNRFACFVVGDIRDKAGFYRNFVSDTIAGFQAAGAKLYNEIILVTAIGSLPVRITKQFQSGRKIGKTHQNILVFFKGNPKLIKSNFGAIE